MVSGKSHILLKAAFAAGAAQYQRDGADEILQFWPMEPDTTPQP